MKGLDVLRIFLICLTGLPYALAQKEQAQSGVGSGYQLAQTLSKWHNDYSTPTKYDLKSDIERLVTSNQIKAADMAALIVEAFKDAFKPSGEVPDGLGMACQLVASLDRELRQEDFIWACLSNPDVRVREAVVIDLGKFVQSRRKETTSPELALKALEMSLNALELETKLTEKAIAEKEKEIAQNPEDLSAERNLTLNLRRFNDAVRYFGYQQMRLLDYVVVPAFESSILPQEYFGTARTRILNMLRTMLGFFPPVARVALNALPSFVDVVSRFPKAERDQIGGPGFLAIVGTLLLEGSNSNERLISSLGRIAKNLEDADHQYALETIVNTAIGNSSNSKTKSYSDAKVVAVLREILKVRGAMSIGLSPQTLASLSIFMIRRMNSESDIQRVEAGDLALAFLESAGLKNSFEQLSKHRSVQVVSSRTPALLEGILLITTMGLANGSGRMSYTQVHYSQLTDSDVAALTALIQNESGSPLSLKNQ